MNLSIGEYTLTKTCKYILIDKIENAKKTTYLSAQKIKIFVNHDSTLGDQAVKAKFARMSRKVRTG